MFRMVKRYTAEFRGGDCNDKPWEWCVVDETEGWCGSAIIFDLTESEAKALAEKMNIEKNHELDNRWITE
jgi:hypothetical protein